MVAWYSWTKAARWAGGTPGTRVLDGLGELEGEGLPEAEAETEIEAPRDQEGEGEGEGEGLGEAVGAGDDDTGPAHGEHQGCLA